MRIAVCDDECLCAQALCEALKQFPFVEEIRSFQSIDLFWEFLDEGTQLDVVFMDIDWKQKKNGIDFAACLYQVRPDVQVIYVTGFNGKYSQQIFLNRSNLCGYLVKPVDLSVLTELLEKAKENYTAENNPKLLIQQKSAIHAVPLRNIIYVESVAHQLMVHTVDETITYYERLDNLKKTMPSCFLQCHKSYLVNMNFIQRVDKTGIVLKTGTLVPISKARYSETKTIYFRYMEAIF